MMPHLRDRDVSAARIPFGMTCPKRCGRDMVLKDLKDLKI